MKLTFLLAALASMTNVYASGGEGHHGSITDLIAPAVNFILLFGFIIYKVRGPLRSFFESKAQTVSQSYDRAHVKAKEAEVMLDMYKKKMANLDTEVSNIMNSSEKDLGEFEREYKQDVAMRSEKIKHDAVARIESEKTSLVNKLNRSVIEEVLAKAKSAIEGNSKLQKTASEKLLRELQ